MALLCLLLGHAPALTRHRNQRFAFSHCLRCHRDMIRSDSGEPDERLPQRWRCVPAGLRVRRPVTARRADARRCRSGMADLLRIATIAVVWHLQDSLRARPKPPLILRLAAR